MKSQPYKHLIGTKRWVVFPPARAHLLSATTRLQMRRPPARKRGNRLPKQNPNWLPARIHSSRGVRLSARLYERRGPTCSVWMHSPEAKERVQGQREM